MRQFFFSSLHSLHNSRFGFCAFAAREIKTQTRENRNTVPRPKLSIIVAIRIYGLFEYMRALRTKTVFLDITKKLFVGALFAKMDHTINVIVI